MKRFELELHFITDTLAVQLLAAIPNMLNVIVYVGCILKQKHKSEPEKEYAKSFERMKNDPAQILLAKAGLDDFLKMIEDYENS